MEEITKEQKDSIETLLNYIWHEERYAAKINIDEIKKAAKDVGKWFYKKKE